MADSKYTRLRHSSDDEGSEEKHDTPSPPVPTRTNISTPILVTAALLLLSLLCNVILYGKLTTLQAQFAEPSYAGLSRNVPTPIPDDNRTLYDEVWNDPQLDTYTGMVALDEDYIRKHDLLPSQPFPWDHSRAMYFIHGFHSLHCVMLLREVVISAHEGKPWPWSMHHATHCLTVLREDVMCYADDFPRYTGPFNAEKGKSKTSSGIGAVRMCRDWSQLRDFAIKNSACFRRISNITTILDRYKFCPDGSKPWESVPDQLG